MKIIISELDESRNAGNLSTLQTFTYTGFRGEFNGINSVIDAVEEFYNNSERIPVKIIASVMKENGIASHSYRLSVDPPPDNKPVVTPY